MLFPRFARPRAARWLVGALVATLVGCASGDTADPVAPPTAPGPAPDPGPPPVPTGAVLLDLTGLPSGARPTVELRAGTFRRTVQAAGRVDSLPVGDYDVTVASVEYDQELWDPTPASARITVRVTDAPPVLTVQFRRRGPRLVVTAVGLPSWARAPVRVNGPAGFSRTVLTGDTLRDLTPGSYALQAEDIETTDGRFEPLPATLTVAVPGIGTVDAPFTYVPATAALTVRTVGLPVAAAANIQLSGPGGFSETIDTTITLRGIPAGVYVARARRVQGGGFTFDPDASQRDVAIEGVVRRSVSFAYTAVTGAIAVVVSGLPPGTEGLVEVTGPGGFARSLTATATLTDLVPGTYRVITREVTADGVRYSGTPVVRDVAVTASLVASPAVVQYVGAVGTLNVEVLGLPADRSATIRVRRPDGTWLTATGAASFPFLPEGDYLVEAPPVPGATFTWYPDPASVTVRVVAQAQRTATVRYVPGTGTLEVDIEGLPASANAAVRVRGPGTFDELLTGSRRLEALAPGAYQLVAQPVASGPTLFSPAPASQTVDVRAGASTEALVRYAASGTSLHITVAGLPAGVMPQVQVAGPSGFTAVVTRDSVLTALAAGSYLVSALPVSDGQYTWGATPASQTVALATGQHASVAVGYAPVTGRLELIVAGLPAGTSAALSVNRAGTPPIPVTGTTTLGSLAAGDWTISGTSVSVGGVLYAPSPASQSVTVVAGQSVSRTVPHVIAAGVPGPNLTVTGLQVTQAIQTPAGTVPLVAGREALLRVFVTASAGNTLTPPVRVRLFDGSTPLRTFTIEAPAGGVPTAVNDAVLTGSWNAVLTAADLRPNLRVQVDVDPIGQVLESDESDNVWPRTGTQGIDVRPVTPFQAVFVPVHQPATGLTGQVTADNLESTFLQLTRRLFPLGEIAASLRAPYTTNAPALQSDDANGAWLTLLNELQALRVAEGSTAHYYGVVGTTYNSGVAGFAYVPGRAALGWDKPASAARVAAHEFGHNFGRQHVAACGSGTVDTNYPYPGGIIGHTGWNAGTGALVSSSTTDIMGYCSNQWTSDYTWNAVLAYRSAGAVAAFGAAPRTVLLVWGRVQRGVVTLEPALRLVTRAALPERPGRYRVELRDKTGRALASLPFEPDVVDHAEEAATFSFAIPLDAFTEARVASIAVTGGRTGTVERAASAVGAAAVGAGAEAPALRTADGGLVQVADPRARLSGTASLRRLTWDDATWPLAVVRESGSGRVLGTLRRSGDGFVPSGGPVTVVFSNGLQSLTQALGPL